MGGSAFLNEVDGNLTLWAEAESRRCSCTGRASFSGPEFEPLHFDCGSGQPEKS